MTATLADVLEDHEAKDDDRPEDCDCGEWNAGGDLACWPCFREGFDRPTSRPEVDQ